MGNERPETKGVESGIRGEAPWRVMETLVQQSSAGRGWSEGDPGPAVQGMMETQGQQLREWWRPRSSSSVFPKVEGFCVFQGTADHGFSALLSFNRYLCFSMKKKRIFFWVSFLKRHGEARAVCADD